MNERERNDLKFNLKKENIQRNKRANVIGKQLLDKELKIDHPIKKEKKKLIKIRPDKLHLINKPLQIGTMTFN